MLEYARWKYVVALLVLMFSALYALPNIFPQDPSVQISANRGGKIDDALKQQVNASLQKVGVKSKAVETKGKTMLVRLADNDTQSKAADALRTGLGDNYVVALSLASTVPNWLSSIGAKPMPLGLDLQGGVHFLMEVDKEAALKKRFDAYLDEARSSLRDNGVAFESVERSGTNRIVATLLPTADAAKARKLLEQGFNAIAVDAGGLSSVNGFRYEAVGNVINIDVSDEMIRQITLNAVEQNLSTLRNRINSLGVAEPVVQRQGAERIVVQLPGVQDTAEAKRRIGAAATLEYRAVYEDGDALEAARTGNVPPGAQLYFRRELGADGQPLPILLKKRVIAAGEDMVDARVSVDQNGLPAVSVTLNTAGGQRMFDFTSENVNKPMAVVFIERIPQTRIVDGKPIQTATTKQEVVSIANVNEAFGKKFITTGLERAEAEDLSRLLKSGALAAPMDFKEERVVGPSLGKQNVERGLKAVMFSFLFALAFFLIYYRMFGIVTCLALLLNLVMVFALMSIFGATMSLP
ncbi:MAG: protein translocase subunit SecD, partial [Xanthomonadaceae bacterium]|nr:protein translocase subunit SecD [Xanthomonadaceae bacterium]